MKWKKGAADVLSDMARTSRDLQSVLGGLSVTTRIPMTPLGRSDALQDDLDYTNPYVYTDPDTAPPVTYQDLRMERVDPLVVPGELYILSFTVVRGKYTFQGTHVSAAYAYVDWSLRTNATDPDSQIDIVEGGQFDSRMPAFYAESGYMLTAVDPGTYYLVPKTEGNVGYFDLMMATQSAFLLGHY